MGLDFDRELQPWQALTVQVFGRMKPDETYLQIQRYSTRTAWLSPDWLFTLELVGFYGLSNIGA